MSKTPARYNKNSSNDIEGKIYHKWQAAVSVVDGFTVKTIDSSFKNLKWSIAEKINVATGNDGSLSSYDEKIYEYYIRLMNNYDAVIQIYNDNGDAIQTENIKNIWDGIYAVLVSRIKLFSENSNDSEVNPVVIEKKGIVTKSIKAFSVFYENLVHRFKLERQKECLVLARKNLIESLEYDSAVKTINVIGAVIENECFGKFYQSYKDMVKSALANLNDLYARRDTHYYNELLMEEHEILHSIIKIQSAVLEKELMEGDIYGAEKDVLDKALYILKEAYQHLSGEIHEIKNLFSETETRNRETPKNEQKGLEEFDEFSESLSSIITGSDNLQIALFDETKTSFAEKYDQFVQMLEDESLQYIKRCDNGLRAKQFIYDCKKEVSEQESMVNEVEDCFRSIFIYYKGNEEGLLSGENADIIKGVSETIEIKLESIEESKQAFVDDMQRLIVKFSEEKIEMNEQNVRKFGEELRENLVGALIYLNKDDKKNIFVLKQKIADSAESEIILNFKEKCDRIWTKNGELLQNKIVRFKKDNLLFELSTFEEIMYYSVSRLRESVDAAVLAFVTFIDDQTKALEGILVKYGIDLIKPLPHELFNGKEHEVLMAEVNEEFKKGEIIKLMNSGYKQGEAVILRANVIAAK